MSVKLRTVISKMKTSDSFVHEFWSHCTDCSVVKLSNVNSFNDVLFPLRGETRTSQYLASIRNVNVPTLRVPFWDLKVPVRVGKIRKLNFSSTKGRKNREISTFCSFKDRNLVKLVPFVKFAKFSYFFSFFSPAKGPRVESRAAHTRQLATLVPPPGLRKTVFKAY